MNRKSFLIGALAGVIVTAAIAWIAVLQVEERCHYEAYMAGVGYWTFNARDMEGTPQFHYGVYGMDLSDLRPTRPLPACSPVPLGKLLPHEHRKDGGVKL